MKLPLASGSYVSRSVLASSQAQINLYSEQNPEDAEFPFSYYPHAGLKRLWTPPAQDVGRGLFCLSNGDLYTVVGDTLYFIGSDFTQTPIRTIAEGSNLCSMRDNALAAILVDGTSSGYAIDLGTRTCLPINGGTSGAFYGADRVDYADTYFVLNQPGTQEFYISLSEVALLDLTGGPVLTGAIMQGSGYTNGTYSALTFTGGSGSGFTADVTVASGVVSAVNIDTAGDDYRVGDVLTATIAGGTGFSYTVSTIGSSAFNGDDIAGKVGDSDKLVAAVAIHREIWLLGKWTTEVWFNSGASDFTYQAMPGIFLEHGCASAYSISSYDLSLFWVSEDKQGSRIIVKSTPYAIERISTHAIENELKAYSTVSDATSFTYQQAGHVFVQFTFPSGDATWVYDFTNQTWSQKTWLDSDGVPHRHRAITGTTAYGLTLVQDWETGVIYQLDPGTYTDDGQPIQRLRSWPHAVADGKRFIFRRFMANLETGDQGNSIDEIVVYSGGSGYLSAPEVTITGDGINAQAYAVMNYVIASLTLTSAGSGYNSAPLVSFSGGGGSGASATATIASVVNTLSLTSGGSGYTSAPTVGFSGGGGSGATATASIVQSVSSLTLSSGGSNYTSAPTVVIGGPGSGAAATAIISGAVSGATITVPGSGYTSAPTVTLSGGGGTGATATATVGSGSIASINVSAGGNYASAPSVVISDPTGSGATATANVSGGVYSITVDEAGSGYTSAPAVQIAGDGTGATAIANLLSGHVRTVTITSSGSGYSYPPEVTFIGGGAGGDFTASGHSNLGATVTSVSVTAPGTGYTSPTISFSGTGSGAAASATVSSGVTGVSITAGGSGYNSAPSISFSGGGGSGAAASAQILGPVASLSISAHGTGYTSAPTVTLSGGGGSGATATATTAGVVTGLSLASGGTGYVSAPTITLSGGGGSGATASATVSSGVSSLVLVSPGTGYSSAPSVLLTGGSGSGASAIATISGSIASVVLENCGTGFTEEPIISVPSPPGGISQSMTAETGLDIDTESGLYFVTEGGVTPVLAATLSGGLNLQLSWSDTKGKTFGSPVSYEVAIGQFQAEPTWNRLGISRDRVFQLTWSDPVPTALLGAWAEVTEVQT